LLGKLCLLYHYKKLCKEALDYSKKILLYYPDFLPACLEQMYVLAELGEWEQAQESAQKLLIRYPGLPDAIFIQVYYRLLHKGELDDFTALNKLVAVLMETRERMEFSARVAQCCAAFAGHNKR
jgi:tetratricopeptide (TPR) repeat protein